MKNRIFIKDLKDNITKEVILGGWVDARRDQGKMVFFDMRDMTGRVQCVVLPNHEEAIEMAKTIRPEWVLKVTALVNKRPEKNIKAGVMNGDLELEVTAIEVLSAAQELPFASNAELNLDTLLDYRPLTLRREREKEIFKTQQVIMTAFREYLDNNNFIEFQAPKIVGGDAEGGAGVFKLEYLYEKPAYLATSPQLYKQMMVGVYERVYTTGPQFRAEKHATTRHLNEISMLDFEMGFIEDHHDVMEVLEGSIKHIVNKVKENCEASLKLFNIDLPKIPEKIPVMKLREAQELIKKETGKDKTNEPDLEPEDERWLCEYGAKEFGSDFIFITHYPVSKRPFYTMEDPLDKGYTKSFDLLFRGVEITSGGQRVHDYQMLVSKMKDKGLDPEKFDFYLMAFKWGLPPHGGIGMGLERLTQKFLGVENVKEATLFPRDVNRIDKRLSE